MNGLYQFLNIYKHTYMKIKLLFSSWVGRIFLVRALAFPALSSVQIALLILLGAFIADFLTGWLASYMEIKRGEKVMPPSGFAFESAKARDSVVKAIGYIFLILGSLALEYLFFDKKFEFTNLSSKRLGITELIIGFCVAVELYSTVVENMKRAGFDIVGKATSAATTLWDMVRKIKGNTEQNG